MMRAIGFLLLCCLASGLHGQFSSGDQTGLPMTGQARLTRGIPCEDGGMVQCGDSYDAGRASSNLFVQRVNRDGEVVWRQVITMPGWQHAADLCADAQGYAVAGWSSHGKNGDRDGLLLRLDTGGNVDWMETYGGIGTDIFNSLCSDGMGGWILAGQSHSRPAEQGNAWFVRVDEAGAVEWDRQYGGVLPEWITGIKPHFDGFVACGSQGHASLNMQLLALKISLSGDIEWERLAGGTDYDCGNALAVGNDGSVLVVGSGSVINQDLMNVQVLCLSPAGAVKWSRKMGQSSYYEYGVSVLQSEAGTWLVLGNVKMLEYSRFKSWLIELDATGQVISESEAMGEMWAAQLLPLSDVLLSLGQVWTDGAGWSMAARSWNRQTAVMERVNATETSVLRAYPNPACYDVAIAVPWRSSQLLHLSVYNLCGQRVYRQTVPAGKPDVSLPAGSLPSGFYLFHIEEAGGWRSGTGTLIIQR